MLLLWSKPMGLYIILTHYMGQVCINTKIMDWNSHIVLYSVLNTYSILCKNPKISSGNFDTFIHFLHLKLLWNPL